MKIGNTIKNIDSGWEHNVSGNSMEMRVYKSMNGNLWCRIYGINTRLKYGVASILPTNYKFLVNFNKYAK